MRKNGRKDLVAGLKRRAVAAVVTGGLAISLITMASEISPSKTMPDFENHNSESEEVLSTESIVSEPVVQETLAEKPTVEKDAVIAMEVQINAEPEPSELEPIMAPEYYGQLADTNARLVLVDILDQHLYAFEGEHIVMDSPVVTGKKDRYDTQLGVYAVVLKKHDYTMRGSYGKVKVGYWMRFNHPKAQGLHDADWRSADSFGGETYVTDGSHGCVNLPPDFTAELYNFVEVGTPVIVQE